MNSTKRIGTIFCLVLAVALLTGLGNSRAGVLKVKPIASASASMIECTGCPDQGTRDDCAGCHTFTRHLGGNDWCDDCAYASEALNAKIARRGSVFELGKITGRPVKMAMHWRDLPMPKDHTEQAIKFRNIVPDCQGRKLFVTE